MKTLITLAGILAATLIIPANGARAAEPPVSLSYQGHITDAAGMDMNSTVALEVRLYDSLIGGIDSGIDNVHLLYAESFAGIDVRDGVFRIGIGEGTPLSEAWTGLPVDDLLQQDRIYLELWINGERLSPRQQLGSLPAALDAVSAKFVDEVAFQGAIDPKLMPLYPASLITSGTLLPEQIPGLNASKIGGTLSADRIPSLPAGKLAKTGTLPAALFSNLDASTIAGTVEASLLPSTEFYLSSDVLLVAGILSHGQHLHVPAGFDASQCFTTFSPTITVGGVEGIDAIEARLNSSGNLICQVYEKYIMIEGKKVPCSAMYLTVCRKRG